MSSIKEKRDESVLTQPSALIEGLSRRAAAPFVDVRNPKLWDRRDVKIRGAVRIDPERPQLDPVLQNDMLLVLLLNVTERTDQRTRGAKST